MEVWATLTRGRFGVCGCGEPFLVIDHYGRRSRCRACDGQLP